MAATAIVVLVPELEPLVGSAQEMPPHVTLLYPFVDDADAASVTAEVVQALARFAPFEVSFTAVRRWPETLYLEPEPAAPFVAITEALVSAFPSYPPYAGAYEEIVPHLTVAHGDPGGFDAVETELAPMLPVRVRVERAWLMAEDSSGWRRHTPFPLNPP